MDNSIHYWKEKLIIAASLIAVNFLIITKLFRFISNSTLLFIGLQTNPIFLFLIYIYFMIIIPGVIISLGIFICILVYYIFIRSLWLFDAEESSTIGKRANNVYLFSFNVLIKSLVFFILFSSINIVLYLILGGELGYYRTYTFYLYNPNNLIYFVAFLITNLLFVESENILVKWMHLPAIFADMNKRKEAEGRKISIKNLFRYYVSTILLTVVVNIILVAGIQFIGSMANQLDLKIQTASENGTYADPLIKAEISIKGITNIGRENVIPIYLNRINRLYRKAEQEFSMGNYLAAINLLQKEINMNSNYSVITYSDRMYPWISRLLSDKISNSILFLKDNLTDSLEDMGNIESADELNKGLTLINKDRLKEYFSLPLDIKDELKINVWRNARGEYSQVFKKSELLNISQVHINKKIGDCFLLLGNYASAKSYYNQALEKNNYYIEAKNNLGYIYMKENNFIKAEDEFKGILNIKPDFVLAKINLGNLYINSGQIEQALNILHSIDSEDSMPARIKAYYYQSLADAFYKKGEINEAKAKYHKALRLDSFYYPASMGLANIYFEKGQFKDAKAIYENILKHNDIAPAYVGLAKYYLHEKDKDKAVEYFNKAINLGNDYEAAREGFIGIGKIFFEKGNPAEAENYFNKAANVDPYYYLPYQELGKIYFSAKKWDSAKNNFLKAIEMFPQNEEVQGLLEEVYKSINKETQAKYEKIVDKEKAGKEKEKLIYAYKNLGWIHLSNGNYDGALKSFEQALSVDPNYIEALQGKGMLFIRMEKYSEAEKIFHKITGINKSYAMAYVGLGMVDLKLNKADQAVGNFEYVNKLDNINAKVQANLELGWLFYNQGNYDMSRDKFLQAANLRENVPEANYGLGMVYEAKKLYENASREFRKAVYLKPDYIQAKEGYKRVTKIISESIKQEVKIMHYNIERENLLKNIEFAINKGELEDARNKLLELLDDNPDDAKALRYLGIIYLQKKMFNESRKQWEKILGINSQDIEARNFLNIINEKIESAKTKEEEYFIPLISEGMDFYNKGEFEKAKEKFIKAASLNDSPIAHKYLGKIYYKFREYDNATRELERSLELDPNQPDIRNSLIKMQNGYTVFKELN